MFVTVMYSFLSRSVIDVRFFSFIQPLTGITSRPPGPLALHFVHWCSYTCNKQCRKPRYFLKQLIFIVIVYIIIVMIVIVICPVMAFESDHKNLPCDSLSWWCLPLTCFADGIHSAQGVLWWPTGSVGQRALAWPGFDLPLAVNRPVVSRFRDFATHVMLPLETGEYIFLHQSKKLSTVVIKVCWRVRSLLAILTVCSLTRPSLSFICPQGCFSYESRLLLSSSL